MTLWHKLISRFYGRKTKARGRRLARRLTDPIRLTLVLVLAFGTSAVGQAAQKIKRKVRNTRSTLKSSYATHMMNRAWGYFRPIWDSGALEKLPGSSNAFEQLVQDPDDRLERDFRVPRALKGRVQFWSEVYGRFDSHFRIVHDRENPERIYGYIDLRPLYRALPARMAQAKAYQIETMILKSLKARLSEAAELSRPRVSSLTETEKLALKKMLSDFGASTPEKAAFLIRTVRTQTGQKDHFTSALQRSAQTLPQVEKIFAEKGLPVALTRLPFVETSFNPRAVSKTGALGMWQFMPDTARLLNPRGTRREWADPIRQSRDATRLLKLLRDRLPDWGVTITAYNSGAARLARIVEKYRVRNVEDLLEIPASKETLGFAGRNFYSEFLAANLIVAYRDNFFSPRSMHIARLNVSRRVQSLLESMSAGEVTPKLTPSKAPRKSSVKSGRRIAFKAKPSKKLAARRPNRLSQKTQLAVRARGRSTSRG